MEEKAKAELEKQLEESLKEIAYYKRLASESGDIRLRETEELSKLITELKNTQKALQKAKDELEKRVDERTFELVNANLVLKQEILERKEIEAALRESEQRFRSLAETTSDWVWEVDRNGVYTYSNPKVLDLLGYEPAEVIGKQPFDFMPQGEQIRIGKFFVDLAESRQPFAQLENVNLHKDGRQIILETSGVPVFDGGGNYSGYRGIDRDVSESRRTEEALQLHEERLRLALTSSRQGWLDLHIPSGTVTVSPEYVRMIGHDPAEFQPNLQGWIDSIHPEDRDDTLQVFHACIKAGDTRSMEYRRRTQTADWLWICSTGKVVEYDSEHKPLRMIGTHQDITERKQAQEALRKSEQRFRELAELLPETIFETDIQGTLTFVNQNAFDRFGYTREEFNNGLNVLGIIASDERGRALANMQRIIKGENIGSSEFTLHRKDGIAFPAMIHSTAIIHDGKPVGLRGFIMDITEHKQMEKALRQSEERFRSLSNASIEGIMIHDQGVILDVNLAFLRLFGYEQPEDLIGKNGPALLLTPESQARIRQRIQEQETGPIEVTGIRKDGTTFEGGTESQLVKYLGRDARIVSMHDVTERKQAEGEKAKLQNQLLQSQKIEAIGQLAGGVAHDFNNMLGVILGHTELALDSVKQSDPLHTHLTEIRNAAQRSSELTSQLLAFARKQTISPKVIDLNDTIDGMLKMLRRLIGEDIDLNWLPDSALWPVKADPSQIDQILANLCVNARDAIQGVGKITIETRNISFDEAYCADHAGFVPGDYVQLCVSDNGSGMDKETLDRLFEPFFTTKGPGKGTGLGLATVYGIVKQNSGYINVYSDPDQGTTFKIYLPRYAGQTELASTEKVREAEMRGQETILLVEDEPSLLELNTLILESQGYRVLAAGAPGEAIRLAEEHRGKIHLLMTDVVMPEMNGRDLAKNLLALNPQLKCLFTSGYTANIIAHHGVLDEGVFFIQKPFSRKDLAAKVREVLEQK